MIIPILCVTLFVWWVVWLLLPGLASLMILTQTASSLLMCQSMVQLVAVIIHRYHRSDRLCQQTSHGDRAVANHGGAHTRRNTRSTLQEQYAAACAARRLQWCDLSQRDARSESFDNYD